MNRVKWMAMLLCALMLPSGVSAAQVADVVYPRGTTPDSMDRYRVALRAAPKDTASVLFRVYNDVPLEVVGQGSGGFVKVRLGMQEGYMMSKYLSDTPQKADSDVWGYVDAVGERVLVRERPKGDAKALTSVLSDSVVLMLAVGEQWHYVMPLEGAGVSQAPTGIAGFVPADTVTEVGNFRYAKTAGGKNKPLYTKPESAASVLSQVGADQQIVILFSPDVHKGWQKVRIQGGSVGFMQDKDLDRSGY